MSNQITAEQRKQAVQVFSDALSKRVDQIAALNISKAHFQQMLLNALVNNPALVQCTKQSLYSSVFKCVEWGMAPDGKHGAIVPMKKQGVMSVGTAKPLSLAICASFS